MYSFFQIIVSSEGKNATTLIRIHIDPPPTTTRKPTTRRPTDTTRNGSSKTRIPTLPRDHLNEEVEVFKSTQDANDNDASSQSDNLESGNHQAFAFTVKENKARK